MAGGIVRRRDGLLPLKQLSAAYSCRTGRIGTCKRPTDAYSPIDASITPVPRHLSVPRPLIRHLSDDSTHLSGSGPLIRIRRLRCPTAAPPLPAHPIRLIIQMGLNPKIRWRPLD